MPPKKPAQPKADNFADTLVNSWKITPRMFYRDFYPRLWSRYPELFKDEDKHPELYDPEGKNPKIGTEKLLQNDSANKDLRTTAYSCEKSPQEAYNEIGETYHSRVTDKWLALGILKRPSVKTLTPWDLGRTLLKFTDPQEAAQDDANYHEELKKSNQGKAQLQEHEQQLETRLQRRAQLPSDQVINLGSHGIHIIPVWWKSVQMFYNEFGRQWKLKYPDFVVPILVNECLTKQHARGNLHWIAKERDMAVACNDLIDIHVGRMCDLEGQYNGLRLPIDPTLQPWDLDRLREYYENRREFDRKKEKNARYLEKKSEHEY